MILPTLILGNLIVLGSTGTFLLSNDLLSLLPMPSGIIMTIFGLIGRRRPDNAVFSYIAAGVSFTTMVFSASAIQRAFRLLSGETLPHAAAIAITAATGVLCLIHVTMSIRWILAKQRSTSA